MADIQSQLPVKGHLTNDNAAPAANNTGALVVLANAASPTFTEGNQVLLSSDLSGNLRTSATLVGTSTVEGDLTHDDAAPVANNLGVLPALANAVTPTFTEGNQVLLSTNLSGKLRTTADLTQVGGSTFALGSTTNANSIPVTIATDQGNLTVEGDLIHDNAAPVANNLGVLPALANAAPPTFTEGNQVLLSTDLSGSLRVSAMQGETSTGVIIDYNTEASVANGSTSTTLTYTVTAGKTLFLKQIIASASGGPTRVQVDYGVGPTIICVGFTSTANPNYDVKFAQPVPIPALSVVRIKIQNNVGVAQDVYGTFIGIEV